MSEVRWLRSLARNRRGSIGGGVAATAVIALCGLAIASPAIAADQTADARAGMTVSVTKVKAACFTDSVLVMGTIVAKNEVLVRPDRDGLQIKEILAETGDLVTAAQILARLTPGGGAPQEGTVAIRAPVGGIVVAAPTIVGSITAARGEPLFRLIADGDLELAADVPAIAIARLAAEQEAKVRVVGMGESSGRVRLVPTTVDFATQLGQVRISLPHNPLIRVGAFARASVDVGRSCGVAIPLASLLFGHDGAVVQLVRDNRIETRRVTTGLFASSDVAIREGLAEGDIIVVRAGAFLRDGLPVRAITIDE